MMNATDLDAQVNPTGEAQPQVQTTPKSFWQRNWPRVFLLLSVVVAVLTFVSVILNFIKIIIKPNVTLLNIYCLIFALLALSAELRQFRWFRKISYHWMKYVYFLTYYKPRGLFYILLGLLLLGDMAILYVAGAIAMFVGIVILVTSFVVGLPVYDDPLERKRELEDARSYYAGRNATPAAFFTKHLGVKEEPQQPDEAGGNDTALQHQQQQQYQPPTLPLREEGKVTNDGSNAPTSPAFSSQGAFSGSNTPAQKRNGTDDDWNGSAAAAASAGPGAAMFGGAAGARPGESQLRREFAAAMDDDASLR